MTSLFVVAGGCRRAYLVFLDFNKSDLTPQAVSIGIQAATAGPAKLTRLTVRVARGTVAQRKHV